MPKKKSRSSRTTRKALVDGQGKHFYCRLCLLRNPRSKPMTYFPVKIPILTMTKMATVKGRTLRKWELTYQDVCIPCARETVAELKPTDITPS